MAKKKEPVIETHEFMLDVSKLTLTKEKYIDQIGQYVQEHVPKSSITRDGNVLNIKVPKETEKRLLRMRITKFLYQSGLKNSFKIVSWIGGKGNGYQILER